MGFSFVVIGAFYSLRRELPSHGHVAAKPFRKAGKAMGDQAPGNQKEGSAPLQAYLTAI
jgi:hypothetical protein